VTRDGADDVLQVPRPALQLHQPRVAELVADALRQRILDGRLEDGELLPNQDTLLVEFGISKPSLREAMRILEAEGLVRVRRGNVGGAVVHRPRPHHAAYTLALVLQAGHVPVDDVVAALKQLEGICAGLCAARPDRSDQVVPRLRECNERAHSAVDDELGYVDATADFHRQLVLLCGNRTMGVLAGSLETLWLTHVREWAESEAEAGTFPDRAYREQGLRVHERLTRYIERGDAARASRLAESHFDPTQFYRSASDGQRRVSASVLRAPGRSARAPGARRDH
jgi:GntR family transcriptional repressor for pyruvate dehydrogenase complex